MLIGLIYFRDSTRFGLPTGDTIEQFRISLRLVWQQFPRAVAPVPSEGSFAIAATTALALCAWLADSFAFRAFGRAEAVVPAGVRVHLHVGARRRPQPGLGRGAVGRRRDPHDRRAAHRARTRRLGVDGQAAPVVWSALPAAVACALFATTGAVAVAPQLPGAGDEALLDTRNRERRRDRGGQPARRHPLAAGQPRQRRVVHRRHRRRPDTWPSPRSVEFDGTPWSTLPEDAASLPTERLADAPPERRGRAAADHDHEARRQSGARRPHRDVCHVAGRTTCCGPTKRDALYVDGGLKPSYQYQVTSADNDPSAGGAACRDRRPRAEPELLRLPCRNLPDEVENLALAGHRAGDHAVRQGAGAAGLVPHAVQVPTTVQRGHSNDAMLNFLSIRKGYCEQFAGTFGGNGPSRSACRRVWWSASRRASCAPTGCTTSSGRHAHAWDEVWFDGYGWVLFEPDARAAAHRAPSSTPVSRPAQDEAPARPAAARRPSTDTDVRPRRSIARDRPEDRGPTGPTTPRIPLSTSGPTGDPAGGWIIVAIVLAIAGVGRRHATRASTLVAAPDRDPAERVTSAWAATVRSLTMAGAPRVAGATPIEYAKSVDVGKAETVEIARLVTRAVYSPRGVDAGAADRSELLAARSTRRAGRG